MPPYAQIAYEGYAHELALHGTWVQSWQQLPQDLKDAWGMAVIVLIDTYKAHVRAQGTAAWQTSQSS